MAKQFEMNTDMIQNIIGFIGLALAIAIGLMHWAIVDFSAYVDETYLFYTMGGAILIFGLIEMFSESKQLEPIFNIIALGTCVIAGIVVSFTYYGYVISDYMIYALAGGAFIWAIAEWFTE